MSELHYKIQHTAEALRGAACYNCRSMEVIHHGRRIRVEEYWCDRQHRVLEEPPKHCEKRRDATL